MPYEIRLVTNSFELSDKLENNQRYPEVADALLTDLGGGLLKFAGVIFPELETDKIYARIFKFGLEDIGPHFDLQSPLVDESYPWVGLYNLSGYANVQTTRLTEYLFREYKMTYQKPGEAALKARMDFEKITMAPYEVGVSSGMFLPGMGLVIPQITSGSQIIHKITSINAENPGEFIKLTAVDDDEPVEELKEFAFINLDELVTKSLGGIRRRSVFGIKVGDPVNSLTHVNQQ
jgi:hypothetical protein